MENTEIRAPLHKISQRTFDFVRYGRVLSVRSSGQIPGGYSDQSYVALNTEAYDGPPDDAALLRPEPGDDRDLMS